MRQCGIWLALCALHLPALCHAGPPPVINVQPTNQAVLINDSVTFSVTASSGTTMWYQWFKNGNILLGASSSSLTFSPVQTGNEGVYSVKVSNIYGSVGSSNATLTVLAPPQFTTPPQSQTVMQGRSAVFWVSTSGSMPMSYQWTLRGNSIPGATNSVLSLTNVQPNIAGSYKVAVSNSVGSTTSEAAILTVYPATPVSFNSTVMTPGGFKLQLSVSSGFTYVISASANMLDWVPISTNSATSSSMTVLDTAATNINQRFYRATAQINR